MEVLHEMHSHGDDSPGSPLAPRTQPVLEDGEKDNAQPPATVTAPAQKPTHEPDLAITPNTIRIQSTDSPKEGAGVVTAGFSELGQFRSSRDGNWIAFDGYKEGFNNSSAESWIARRDGRREETLGIGWFRANWMADSKSVVANGVIGEKLGWSVCHWMLQASRLS